MKTTVFRVTASGALAGIGEPDELIATEDPRLPSLLFREHVAEFDETPIKPPRKPTSEPEKP